MEVSVISVENIKPSSPLQNLKPYKICLLDQLMISTYSPFILFYKNNHLLTTEKISKQLKTSLSNTLNPFYTLSGRLRDNLNVHDFHQGVPFTETRVKGYRLHDLLKRPDLGTLNSLLPIEPFCFQPQLGSPQLSVQLNTFDCGGIGIGMCFYHKTVDGLTAKEIVESWAANNNPNKALPRQPPDLSAASSVFPPVESIPPPLLTFAEKLYFREGGKRCASKRFVFSNDAVKALRTIAKGSKVENPTRAESVSAFIWRSAMSAAKDADSSTTPRLRCFTQAVNIRPIMRPHLSKGSLGNLFTAGTTSCRDETASLQELVSLIRSGVARINGKYLESISGEKGLSGLLEGMKGLGEMTSGFSQPALCCSSWIGLGANEVDFGWGKPVWSGVFGEASGDQPCVELVGSGDVNGSRHSGIEAWVRLDEDVMAVLEQDADLFKFASPNPPVVY
ncbi:Stemmadenine O-acetyltransferase [Linum perenne]